ncbi:MAG: ACT domain-containing protein [Deltaproteobacteria bacterium]|nr:ACT domain-containing protein [Deltaproteobacteria bacterium]
MTDVLRHSRCCVLALLSLIAALCGANDLPIIDNPCATALLASLAQTPAFVERTPVHIEGKPAVRLMIVLRTNGCYFDKGDSGCTICNYKQHAIDPRRYRVNADNLSAQLDLALQNVDEKIEQIDLLTLGNYLNQSEVPLAFWKESMARLSKLPRLKRVVIESRTKFIQESNIEIVRSALRADITLEVSIGVESSNDYIRNEIIKKKLAWKELEKAVDRLAAFRDRKVVFQAYLLIKPQRLTEREAIEDVVQSAVDVAIMAQKKRIFTRIAFEPVFVTHDTELEKEFLAGRYHPVKLWSIVEIIKRVYEHPAVKRNPFVTSIFVGMSDENLSSGRKASSCSHCEAMLLRAIEAFNSTQNIGTFSLLVCPQCRPEGEVAMNFKLLPESMSLMQIPPDHTGSAPSGISAVIRTADEQTVIAPTAALNQTLGAKVSHEWRAIQLEGTWEFSEVGIISKITQALADSHVSCLAFSTWNTDYLLVQESQVLQAVSALEKLARGY